MTGGTAVFVRRGASVWTAGRAADEVSARRAAGKIANMATVNKDSKVFFNSLSIFGQDSIRASLNITKRACERFAPAASLGSRK
jgi:hypothetical protein